MSPRKLTDADKSDILNLYRNPEETTSTLAVRYGVSNSTISRILKSNLLESEYEDLIQQKRLNRTPGSASSSIIQTSEPLLELEVESAPVIQPLTQLSVELETQSSVENSQDGRRRRRRSSLPHPLDTEERAIQTELPLHIPGNIQEDEPEELLEKIEQAESSRLEELLDHELIDDDDDLDDDDDDLDDDDDDLDDDDDDDWDDEGEDGPSQPLLKTSLTQRGINVQVLPLSEASLPKTCYLVVDRAAELVARPLKEFSDLGQIPTEEVQERTLPIFDNHKVARRFSNRSQRVIKVPDSRMLQKAGFHLQAKGITRLLIDGQVYSLLPTQPES